MFMALGAYRSGQKVQWLLIVIYLAAIALILVAPPTAATQVPSFAKAAQDYFAEVAPALGRLLGVPGLSLDSRLIAPKFAIVAITSLYLGAAIINLFIPRLPIDHKLPSKSPLFILHDFWHSFKLLWRDPLGQRNLHDPGARQMGGRGQGEA